MSYYMTDDNGNQRARIILVNEDGTGVVSGEPIGSAGKTHIGTDGLEYLLCIAYDEDGVAQ